MDELVFGVSLYSIKIQFAKRIRVEVHGIVLSLLIHIKKKSNCQYYFVLLRNFLTCLDEWDSVSTKGF